MFLNIVQIILLNTFITNLMYIDVLCTTECTLFAICMATNECGPALNTYNHLILDLHVKSRQEGRLSRGIRGLKTF